MTISKEAIEAGIKAADHFYLYEATDSDTAFGQAVEAGIRAALPFLPIAGEGKEWQPISSAPKDGTEVDLWCVRHTGKPLRVTDMWWTQSTGWRNGNRDPKIEALARSATHWRLPPASPSSGGQEVVFAYAPRGFTGEGYVYASANDAGRDPIPLYTRTQPASTALVEKLMKALEPFCKHYEPWMERWDDQEASSTFSRHTFGDLREALAAINEARAALSASTRSEGER